MSHTGVRDDAALDTLVKRWPPTAAVKLGSKRIEGLIAAFTDVVSGLGIMLV